MEGWRKENVATTCATVALVLGLYWMSESWHAYWGLVMLLNLNTPGRRAALKG